MSIPLLFSIISFILPLIGIVHGGKCLMCETVRGRGGSDIHEWQASREIIYWRSCVSEES